MAASVDVPIGERIRFFREAQHKTQAVVAGLAGITVEYLSQIERGHKTPSIPVLFGLADILGVPASALLGEPVSQDQGRGHPATAAIQGALFGYRGPLQGDPPTTEELRERLDQLWHAWCWTEENFTQAGQLVPDLVTDIEHAIQAQHTPAEAERRREAHRLAFETYTLLQAWSQELGRTDLSLLMADRAIRAAESTEDPVVLTAANYAMGHGLLAANELESARELMLREAEKLQPSLRKGDRLATGMLGALHLVAAIAAVRSRDAGRARTWINDVAQRAADKVGELNPFHSSFGPANVALHAMAVETECGQGQDAMRLAERVPVDSLSSLMRRAHFYLDLARAYEQRRDDIGLLVHLNRLRMVTPEFARYNVIVREMVRGLLKRSRRSNNSEINSLARHVGVVG